MPSRSSRSHIAYLVWTLPGRGFFVCENLIAAIMPPSSTSSRWARLPIVLLVCVQKVSSDLLELRERMARQVVAENFLLLRERFLLVPRGNFGQRRRASAACSSSSSSPNRPFWPERRSAAAAAPDCSARSSTAMYWARWPPSLSNAPALISASIVARLQSAGSTRSQKSKMLRERAVLRSLGGDRLGRRAAARLDRRSGRSRSCRPRL